MPNPDFAARFPSMTPITKAPNMNLAAGIGQRVVGARDLDPETRSYITTLCFCILFIPIFAIRAYRVVNSPNGGWYFIGREPLSTLARSWNLFFGLALISTLAFTGVSYYTGRPEYIAQQQMQQARRHAEEGRLTEAAAICRDLIIAGRHQSQNALAEIKDMLNRRCSTASDEEAAGAFAAAADVTSFPGAPSNADLVGLGLPCAQSLASANPRGAIAVLDVLRPLALDPRELDAARLPLLKKWVETEPQSLPAAVALAGLLDDMNQPEDAKKLLLPFKDKLGNGEGARILGGIYAQEDKLDEAAALLSAYVKPRLDALHKAETAYGQLAESLSDRELEDLRNEKAPRAFYDELKNASEERRRVMVDDYIQNRMTSNADFRNAREAFQREVSVVPVAMDLGIVTLRRAQAIPNAAERKKQLESAKEVFLSIKSAAGESDQFRLFLGQVYYWLGDQAQGRKLFDEFLVSKGRSGTALIQIGATLRSVGVDPEARGLAEEAWNKSTDAHERFDAARLRALVSKDEDDHIEWLRKCNLEIPLTRADLATALGNKALREGRDDEAATQLRSAIDTYQQLPRNESSLNQTSLAYYSLFRATNDPKDMERCLDAMQQAVALDPSDPVLLYNAGMTNFDASLTDILAKEINLHALRRDGDLSLFPYLYKDQAGREVYRKRLAEHPGILRGLGYMDKVMVVSPKSDRAYSAAIQYHRYLQNDAALRAIEERLKAAGVDTADHLRTTQEFLTGQEDAKRKTDSINAIRRQTQVESAARQAGGVELAVWLANRFTTLLLLDMLGEPANADTLLDLAKQAHAAAPSSATIDVLTTAHQFRVYQQLSASDAAFAAFAKTHLRSIGVSRILAFQISENGPFAAKIKAHADFQAAITLMKEDLNNFPQGTPLEWAFFRRIDPPFAEKLAENIRNNRWLAPNQSIERMLAPGSGSGALDAAWLAQVHGRDEEARAILNATRALGIPVPSLP